MTCRECRLGPVFPERDIMVRRAHVVKDCAEGTCSWCATGLEDIEGLHVPDLACLQSCPDPMRAAPWPPLPQPLLELRRWCVCRTIAPAAPAAPAASAALLRRLRLMRVRLRRELRELRLLQGRCSWCWGG